MRRNGCSTSRPTLSPPSSVSIHAPCVELLGVDVRSRWISTRACSEMQASTLACAHQDIGPLAIHMCIDTGVSKGAEMAPQAPRSVAI